MTEPTDSEILDAADDFRSQYMHGGITFDEFDAIGFARAVLAKFGTPPAMAGQLADEQIEDLLECGNPTDDEKRLVRMGWDAARNAPLAQAQATPQSGAKSFQTYAEANAYSRGYYAGKKAATQAQAGAVPLTDAQIDQAIAELGLNYLADAHATNRAVLQKLCRHAHGIKGGQHG